MAYLDVYIKEDFFKERPILRDRINRKIQRAGRGGLLAPRPAFFNRAIPGYHNKIEI